jgi:hypothetical protein
MSINYKIKNFMADVEIWRSFKKQAASRDISASCLLRRLIKTWTEKQEIKQSKKIFYKEERKICAIVFHV